MKKVKRTAYKNCLDAHKPQQFTMRRGVRYFGICPAGRPRNGSYSDENRGAGVK